MKLHAVSDLHLSFAENRQALREIAARPDDWLILAGDIGETAAHLAFALEILAPRFRQLIWAPGNHDLWTLPVGAGGLRGAAKYEALVTLCRTHGVLTPEDDYPIVAIGGRDVRLAPLFLLYDYSFRPADVPAERAVEWAGEAGVHCADERLLYSDPYASVVEWCHARCAATEARLEMCRDGLTNVLINHFPLREDLVRLPRIPRFSIWCGTRRTEAWHVRFNASVVVSGHLHIRSTHYRDGVRFEEVSLGYPKQWKRWAGPPGVRQILPLEHDPEKRPAPAKAGVMLQQ